MIDIDLLHIEFAEALQKELDEKVKEIMNGTSNIKPRGLLAHSEKQIFITTGVPIIEQDQNILGTLYHVAHDSALAQLDGRRVRMTYYDEMDEVNNDKL